MTQNAMQAKKSRSFTVGVSFRLSSYYSLLGVDFLIKNSLLTSDSKKTDTPRWIEVQFFESDIRKRCFYLIFSYL